MSDRPLPLTGVKVLDLSTLLPGPLATLMLAEAGADVVKLERPGRGDEMRSYEPKFGEASGNYAVLNRGKRAYGVDFKDPAQRDRVLELAAEADIVVEQFRPGVADRLGLGFEDMKSVNPDVIYCSITGYGPTGPAAQRAGHDLNYLAESGLLGTVVNASGEPSLPVTVLADIAAGTYPAVVNILLALRQRDLGADAVHLQISMTHNLHVLSYGYFAAHQAGGQWPRPGAEQLTGGSPRYHLYRTADGRHIAVAALEQKFWERLVELVELDPQFHDDLGQEAAVIEALGERFASRDAEYWRSVLDGEDVCSVVVSTWEEAVSAGLVDIDAPERVIAPDGDEDSAVSTLPSPIDPRLRHGAGVVAYPRLADLGDTSPWA